MSAEIGGPKITPMFAQYLGMKEEYPDSLLFFRMGDFYELFFEDAEIAARELQIALTCRNPNQEVRVPMCGVPHHAVEHYLGQLLEKGYKVAICDQIEDPRQAKGLVKRAVTRVMTPGTIVEDSGLSAKAHNYLAAVGWNADRGHGALAFADVSTGEWTGFETRDTALLWQWLALAATLGLCASVVGRLGLSRESVVGLGLIGYMGLPWLTRLLGSALGWD